MKSIKTRILVSMIATVAVSLALVGAVACALGYRGTQATLESSMLEMATVAADRVAMELKLYSNIASECGCLERLSDPLVALSEKKDLLQNTVDANELKRYNLLDTKGVSMIDGKDYSHREYVQEALQGKVNVSEPLISSVTGEVTVIVAAPVWQNGRVGSQVVGVVYFVPQETFLNDIVSSIKVSAGGSAYMLDEKGNTIAHENMENVRDQENTIEDAKSDKSLTKLAAIESDMIAGNTGFAQYKYAGVTKFSAYAPVPQTDGWSIAISAPTSDFTGAAVIGIIVTVIMLGITAAVASLVAVRLAAGIGRPIKACADRLQLLAQGNLEEPVPEYVRNDEVGELVNSTSIIVVGLTLILKDIDYMLGEMGNGNFVVDSQAADRYIGDFEPLLESMRRIKGKLSDVLTQINVSADQIASGANQVSDGAQALAQGATEQASSVQELAATIHDIAQNVDETSRVAVETQEKAKVAGGQVVHSNELMGQMTAAMDEITDFSRKIENIITTIEDIAFQTNILALNAAVEAARAGSAGKGFAVVADEVRNLAAKSDQAAKATKELIEGSIKSVRNGSTIVEDVTDALHKTTELAGQSVQDMVRVAEMVGIAASAVSQVTNGLDQVSSVVQTNSATSEESAAASEELSSQAQLLNSLVAQFKLPESSYAVGLTDLEGPKF